MLKMKRFFLCQTMILCLVLLAPLAAFAIGSISVVPVGNSTFNVVANGLGAPQGIHVRLTYDTTLLGPNPKVVQGDLVAGGMFMPNANVPGEVQIAAVSQLPMKGSGILATVTFNLIGATAGTVNVSGVGRTPVIDGASKNIPVQFFSSIGTDTSTAGGGGTPTDTGTGTTTGTGTSTGTSVTSGTTSTTTGTGTGTASPVVGGTVTLPTDDMGMRDRKDIGGTPPSQPTPQDTREAQPVPVPAVEAAAPSAPPEQPAAKKPKAELPMPVQSVLEKFRLFTGEKTPQSLMALFYPEKGVYFTQTPAIFLADGKTSVKVVVTKVPGEQNPSFSFNQANYVSLNQTGETEWQIEVMPEKGTTRASISMIAAGGQLLLPLVTAPSVDIDLDKSGTVDEADFQLFLKNGAKYDLNGDGKRDYQDDYIFTANYLVKKGMKVPQPVPAKKAQ